MNILVVNDDGPAAHGLTLMREAARQRWSHDKIVTIVPKTDQSGVGMGIKGSPKLAKPPVRVEKDFYTAQGATPVDIIHHAFSNPDTYLQRGTWDLVLTGVNHGANVGMSIFTSGTVGAAMMAVNHYGTCAVAFSQAFGPAGKRGLRPKGAEDTNKAFRPTAQYLQSYLRSLKVVPGTCQSYNFPAIGIPVAGPIYCAVAPFDPYVGTGFLPHAAEIQQFDVALLNKGYITQSELILSFNPPQQY